MDTAQLTELLDEFNYLLGRVSKYLKNNQYVYLRAFDSWNDSYNSLAERLNADRTLSVPRFKTSAVDYSPSGKSIKLASVEKFVKMINHQISRLEEKIESLNKATEIKHAAFQALQQFFHRDADDLPVVPPLADKRIFIAIPAGDTELQLFWQGIQPALETQGLSFFRADREQLDDAALCEICQQLYSCRLAIINLSGQAANVMFTLGLAYATGKPLVLLQQREDAPLGETSNTSYLRYTGAADLKASLRALLPTLLKNDR
ncbi:MAG TPA: hypothetical protein VIR78_06510 [Malonomonas sp.]